MSYTHLAQTPVSRVLVDVRIWTMHVSLCASVCVPSSAPGYGPSPYRWPDMANHAHVLRPLYTLCLHPTPTPMPAPYAYTIYLHPMPTPYAYTPLTLVEAAHTSFSALCLHPMPTRYA